MKKAEIYLQGEIVTGELINTNTVTYIAPLLTFRVLTGRFTGETIAIFENGDKFRKWL